MSIDIRYLTNGVKTFYTVVNSGVTPIERNAYLTREEIPQSIRHYAPEGDPVFVGPDLAAFLGVQKFFYPDFPKCGHPMYSNTRCVAESCRFAPDENWRKCKYFPGYEMKGENNGAI